jgi:hypothetical protein
VLLALKARQGDLKNVCIVRKHSLGMDYLLCSRPVVSAEMKGKSQEWKRRVEGEINDDSHR